MVTTTRRDRPRLIANPALVLADGPTGNLDNTTGNEIIELLLGLREQHDTA
ncbi:hypothetical protein V3G39_13770 [Dermatophilaceae bacterium Sec6.4]